MSSALASLKKVRKALLCASAGLVHIFFNLDARAPNMHSISIPKITYGVEFRNSLNPFRDKFGGLADAHWKEIWL